MSINISKNLDIKKLGKVSGIILGNMGTDYVFNLKDYKKEALDKLNKLIDEKYSVEQITWYRGKFITNDVKYFTSPPDKEGYSYWMKIKRNNYINKNRSGKQYND